MENRRWYILLKKEAECKALSNWTEEEINLYLKLTERYHADLKNEIESL